MLVQELSFHARYRTVTALGRSETSETLLVTAPTLADQNRLAVVRRIWPELCDDPDFSVSFLQAASLALRLRHPNIVQVFDLGKETGGTDSEAGRYFVATEYLPGQPLTAVLERLQGSASFGLRQRLQIILELLRALEYAHGRADLEGGSPGLVHGNICPANVFVGYNGAVKVMGFDRAGSLPAAHHSTYGAPERLHSFNVDDRADLFSVGVMMWEMLADRRMFRGRTRSSIARMLAGEEPLPALGTGRPIPGQLRGICERAIALAPGARYQTAREFREELTRAVREYLPPDARTLGATVSRAFQAEKQAMQWLIDRFLEPPGKTAGPPRTTWEWDPGNQGDGWRSSGSLPAIEVADVTVRELMPGRPARAGRIVLGAGALLAGALAVIIARPPSPSAKLASSSPPPAASGSAFVTGPHVEPLSPPMAEAPGPAIAPDRVARPPEPPLPAPEPTVSRLAPPARPDVRRRPRLPRAIEPSQETTEGPVERPALVPTPAVPPSRRLPDLTIDGQNPYRP